MNFHLCWCFALLMILGHFQSILWVLNSFKLSNSHKALQICIFFMFSTWIYQKASECIWRGTPYQNFSEILFLNFFVKPLDVTIFVQPQPYFIFKFLYFILLKSFANLFWFRSEFFWAHEKNWQFWYCPVCWNPTDSPSRFRSISSEISQTHKHRSQLWSGSIVT